MVKPFNKKKIICIIFILVIVVVIGSVTLKIYTNTNKTYDLTKIEYRTDIEPITNRFGDLLSIETCFWKAGTIGKTNFGPSSYWIKGFAFISQENATYLKSKYNFSSIDICWEKGMIPNITGKNKFKWSYNKELSRKIAGVGFGGECYFDIENNIFYFDLVSR